MTDVSRYIEWLDDDVPIELKKLEWFHYKKKPVIIRAVKMDAAFKVMTLEGIMVGNKGDYLIEGVKGELYPCKPDVFYVTYEREYSKGIHAINCVALKERWKTKNTKQ